MKNEAYIVKQINHRLSSVIGTELPILKKVKGFVSKNAGKCLRPLFHYYIAKLLAYEGEEWQDVGAVGELIHTASLFHDDVIDSAQVRRERPSLNFIYGNKVSVLSGDYLLACALEHLNTLEHCSLVLPLFTRSVRMLAMGELLQMESEKKFELSEAIYEKIILCKTACLFGSMSESAYVLSQGKKADPKIQLKYKNFGERLGRLFQLRDDFLDYFQMSKSTGKELYQDLERGLITKPIIVLYKNLPRRERKVLLGIFKNSQKRKTPSNIKKLESLFRSVNLRERLERGMEVETHILLSFLRSHPPSAYRSRLLDKIFQLFILSFQE